MKQREKTEEDIKILEELMARTPCLKDFRCVENGFDNLCKAKDIGIEDHLICIEKNQPACIFAFPFGGSLFCRCPVRVYVAKNLECDYDSI